MTDFAEVMGLQFNEEKTGTIELKKAAEDEEDQEEDVVDDEEVSDSSESTEHLRESVVPKPIESSTSRDNLPKGDVRWGFLKLDPGSKRFKIDQSNVNDHIDELRRQLSATKSVFAWVQVWNQYLARFFSNNFGKPAYCFGREHIDMMIETFARIHRQLFPSGSVTDHLRGILQERFGVKDVPDGFFYFPVEMGGLELRNPFIPLFAMRETIKETPAKVLEDAFDKDEENYVAAKEHFKKNNTGAGLGKHSNFKLMHKLEDSKSFMSAEEFHRYREETSRNLFEAYKALLEVPTEKHVEKTPEVSSALEKLPQGQGSEEGICKSWDKMTPYFKWVTQMYLQEMVNKYGGLNLVEKGVVPLGVVNMLRGGKVKWQG